MAQRQALEGVRRCLILLREFKLDAVSMHTMLIEYLKIVVRWNEYVQTVMCGSRLFFRGGT